jgi:Uma2 family endonuclease
MNAVVTPPQAELLHRVGDVPRERIIFDPPPGTATIADVIRLCDGDAKRRCELVDGVLVEKAMGNREGMIEGWLSRQLGNYLEDHPLGVWTTGSGTYRLLEDQIRFPDVAFTSWDRIPVDADPKVFAPDWVPNLAVEILSPSNTRGEMLRKLQDYFTAGVDLVWYVDPDQRTVEVFTGVDRKQVLTENDTLTGGTVLPGFQVSVREIFESGQLRRPKQ